MSSTETLIRELADRAELTELVARHTLWIDGGLWDETDRIFTEDVTVTSIRGCAEGTAALLALVRKGHDQFEATLHSKSNTVIDLDGDTARVHTHDIGVFLINAGEVAFAAGVHEYTARRTADGWRFDSLEVKPVALTAPIEREL